MYNLTGNGISGTHYDPLLPRAHVMRSQLVPPPVPTGHHGDPGLKLDGKGRVAIGARNLCEHDSENTAREQQRIAYDPETQGLTPMAR